MNGRWRVFRQNGGRERRVQALVYLLLYSLCLGLSYWNTASFQTVIFWPANAVLLAAFLQLPWRYALGVMGLCFMMNMSGSLFLGGGRVFAWIDPILNLLQVLVAGVLARRYCGAALDMRRPKRLLSFVLFAALPAVALTTLINISIVSLVMEHSLVSMAFLWRHMFAMELLGLVTFTPCLLLIGQAKRFRLTNRSFVEVLALLLLLGGLVFWIFNQRDPYLFMIFPPLMIMAYRLTPPWVAVGLIMTTFISGGMTLKGYGPIAAIAVDPIDDLKWAQPILLQLPVYYVMLLVAAMSSLALSAMVSERRAMLQRLAQRDEAARVHQQRLKAAMEAKSRFLAMMSHEMRNPLNVIRGFSDLLMRRPDLADEAQQQVQSIRDAGGSLLAMIEDVLHLAQGDLDQRITEFDLEEALRKAVAEEEAQARAKGVGFTFEMAFNLPLRVRADPYRLQAALHHIVSNAVKFTDDGEVRLVAHQKGDRLTLTVSDTGCGVAIDFIPHMFEMFTQNDVTLKRRHCGAGVGLATARRHAHSMDGDVQLISTSKAGTTMELSARVEPVAFGVRPETEAVPLTPIMPSLDIRPLLNDLGSSEMASEKVIGRVLIVDDHPINRSLLRLMVEGEGYVSLEAPDGKGAVDMASKHTFDVILMDVRMPGMDGMEASRLIRSLSRQPYVPIIAVTADALADDTNACLAAGMDAHIKKPVARDDLLSTIKRVIALNQSRQSEGTDIGSETVL